VVLNEEYRDEELSVLLKVGQKGLSCVDLVSTLGVENPITHKRFCLAGVLGVMNTNVNILLRRLIAQLLVNRGLVDVTDFTETPTGDSCEIFLGYLDGVYIQRLTDIPFGNASFFHEVLFVSRGGRIMREANYIPHY